jgi:PhzF family phenazine biosynthesis protein
MSKPFKQVDVFTSERFKGNPLAVFFEGDDLSDQEMQSMSNWTNLSETTFVLKPTNDKADYQVRIFTTMTELPFAGHPTIGTCFALLELKLIKPNEYGKVYQQCLGGLVELTIENYDENDLSNVFISFQLPFYQLIPMPISNEQVEDCLNLPKNSISSTPVIVFDGPRWATVELSHGDLVKDCKPNFDAIKKLSIEYNWIGIGIFGKYDNGDYELRNFAPLEGCNEDPACGSGAGAVGVFLSYHLKRSDVNTLTLNQGVNLNRNAKLKVSIITKNDCDPTIIVGGQAITIVDGKY